jgi:hypothetical protein
VKLMLSGGETHKMCGSEGNKGFFHSCSIPGVFRFTFHDCSETSKVVRRTVRCRNFRFHPQISDFIGFSVMVDGWCSLIGTVVL